MSTLLTLQGRLAIRERLRRVWDPQHPWSVTDTYSNGRFTVLRRGRVSSECPELNFRSADDAKFCAHAPEDVRALLEHVTAVEEENRQKEKELQRLRGEPALAFPYRKERKYAGIGGWREDRFEIFRGTYADPVPVFASKDERDRDLFFEELWMRWQVQQARSSANVPR